MSFSKNLKEKASITWEACYNHSFVQELGKGTLDIDKFQFYLIQDYKYLLEYAKVFAIGALKSDNEKLMTNFTMGQYSILNNEMDLHRSYMKTFVLNFLKQKKANLLFLTVLIHLTCLMSGNKKAR